MLNIGLNIINRNIFKMFLVLFTIFVLFSLYINNAQSNNANIHGENIVNISMLENNDNENNHHATSCNDNKHVCQYFDITASQNFVHATHDNIDVFYNYSLITFDNPIIYFPPKQNI